mmetsp:Transcript_103298/g.267129  ORF Transcript_103298/g.267129 Transcript_103298/m.267129 type:complete len:209 (+) Transcript_103298:210-836(+)
MAALAAPNNNWSLLRNGMGHGDLPVRLARPMRFRLVSKVASTVRRKVSPRIGGRPAFMGIICSVHHPPPDGSSTSYGRNGKSTPSTCRSTVRAFSAISQGHTMEFCIWRNSHCRKTSGSKIAAIMVLKTGPAGSIRYEVPESSRKPPEINVCPSRRNSPLKAHHCSDTTFVQVMSLTYQSGSGSPSTRYEPWTVFVSRRQKVEILVSL